MAETEELERLQEEVASLERSLDIEKRMTRSAWGHLVDIAKTLGLDTTQEPVEGIKDLFDALDDRLALIDQLQIEASHGEEYRQNALRLTEEVDKLRMALATLMESPPSSTKAAAPCLSPRLTMRPCDGKTNG